MPEFRRIPVALTDPPENPSRTTFDEVAMRELMDSIQKHGLFQAVVVVEYENRFRVRAGHRRLVAHQNLRLETIPALVFAADEADFDSIQLDENEIREGLNPADEALYVATLWEKSGIGVEEIAKKLNRSVAWVDQRYALLTGSDAVFRALKAGQVNIGVATELNRIKRQDLQDYYLSQAVGCGATREMVHQWVYIANTIAMSPEPPPMVPIDPGPNAPLPPLPLACALCDGDKDPYNLIVVHIHPWHVRTVKRMMIDLEAKKLME